MTEDKDLQQENMTTEENNEETTERFDYSNTSRADLIKLLTELIDTKSPLEIKSEVETLKSVFYLKLAKEQSEAKAAFINNEGKEDDFKMPVDELESIFKAEQNRYRELRNTARQQIENERTNNLAQKLALIEELKSLVEKEENIKETFDVFHSIQEKWRNIGPVPTDKNDSLWQTYHLHVEHFYDYIKINHELKELDYKRNLETKEILCTKAEALAGMTSVIDAFKILQVYHQEWKETGPVAKDLRDSLWERFKAATTIINKRHQDFFETQKAKELENLALKEVLCEKIEALCQDENSSAKKWNNNVTTIQTLQEEWKKIGYAPKKENSEVYSRFRKACDLFFAKKREFYKLHNDEQNVNLENKKALLEKAIALKDSENWKATTDALIALQKEWKKVGAIPRKYSEKLWGDFREACDIFFERKKEFYSKSDNQQDENLKLKIAVIDKIKTFETSENPEDDIKILLAYKDEWLAIGHVPIKEKNKLNNDYHNELNAQFDKLNLKREDREIEKFRSKLGVINDNSGDKIYAERRKLALQLKELESEIGTLENNIGFLSKSKSTEGLVKEYTLRIEKAKKQKAILSKKIRMIDTME